MSYKVIRAIEEPVFVDGKPEALIRVEFAIGEDGPFFERFKKAEFSELAVRQRLEAFERELAGLRR